jgi:dCMP deaminase
VVSQWIERLGPDVTSETTSRPRTRPDWDAYALGIAEAVSVRSDCIRRLVGAVVLDSDHRIIGTGYPGTRPGGPSCLAGDCQRAESDVPPLSSYDTGPGACISTHAEINAIMDVDNRERLTGATLVVTCQPCAGCMKIIVNATKIARIVWPDTVLELS